MLIHFEEQTHGRQAWQKQEMDEVDVERAAAYVLQRGSNDSHLREIVLIMTEIHQGDDEQQEHCRRQRNNGPRHAQGVPLQGIHRAQHGQHDDDGEEPLRVHQSLGAVPIAMGYIAKEEERHPEHQLSEAGVYQELVDVCHSTAIALSPREVRGLIATVVERYRDQEQHHDEYSRRPLRGQRWQKQLDILRPIA